MTFKTKCIFINMIVLFFFIPNNTFSYEINILGGGPDGTYIKIAKDIAELCSERGLRMKEHTGGSIKNIEQLLTSKHAQFAIVQYDALLFKELEIPDLKNKIKMLFPLYNEEIHVIARADSDIKNLSDFSGKRINMEKKDTGHWVTSYILKKHLGLDFEEYHMKTYLALDKIRKRELDGCIAVYGQPAPLLAGLNSEWSKNIKLVSLPVDIYVDTIFKGGTYPWQTSDVHTKATKAVLVTYNYFKTPYPKNSKHKRFNHYYDNMQRVLQIVKDNLAYLRSNKHKKWNEINPFQRFEGIQWPYHQEAEKILFSKGEEPEIDSLERQLEYLNN